MSQSTIFLSKFTSKFRFEPTTLPNTAKPFENTILRGIRFIKQGLAAKLSMQVYRGKRLYNCRDWYAVGRLGVRSRVERG